MHSFDRERGSVWCSEVLISLVAVMAKSMDAMAWVRLTPHLDVLVTCEGTCRVSSSAALSSGFFCHVAASADAFALEAHPAHCGKALLRHDRGVLETQGDDRGGPCGVGDMSWGVSALVATPDRMQGSLQSQTHAFLWRALTIRCDRPSGMQFHFE